MHLLTDYLNRFNFIKKCVVVVLDAVNIMALYKEIMIIYSHYHLNLS